MHPEKITIVDWITDAEATGKPCSVGGLGGCVEYGGKWEDYFTDDSPHLNALRAEIIAKNIRFGGDFHQSHNGEDGTPLFSDGSVASMSMRAWGDLLAATWASQDDAPYCYMDFYMGDGPTAEEAKARPSAVQMRVDHKERVKQARADLFGQGETT